MSSYDSVSDEGSITGSDYSSDGDGGNPFIEPEAPLKSSNPFVSEKEEAPAPATSKPDNETKKRRGFFSKKSSAKNVQRKTSKEKETPKEAPREAPNGRSSNPAHRLEKNGVSAHPLQAAPKAAVAQEKSRRGSVSRSALPSATLQIDLVEARNITVNSDKKHKGSPNTFVTFRLGRQEQKSKVAKKSREPRWGQRFTFDVADVNRPILNVEMFDRDRLKSNRLIGGMAIALSALPGDGTPLDKWFSLTLPDSSKKRPTRSVSPQGADIDSDAIVSVADIYLSLRCKSNSSKDPVPAKAKKPKPVTVASAVIPDDEKFQIMERHVSQLTEMLTRQKEDFEQQIKHLESSHSDEVSSLNSEIRRHEAQLLEKEQRHFEEITKLQQETIDVRQQMKRNQEDAEEEAKEFQTTIFDLLSDMVTLKERLACDLSLKRRPFHFAADFDECRRCFRPFKKLGRKNNCRKCGQVVCKDCTTKGPAPGWPGLEKVCTECPEDRQYRMRFTSDDLAQLTVSSRHEEAPRGNR